MIRDLLGEHAGCAVLMDHAAAAQPRRVLTATVPLPLPRHAIAVTLDDCLAHRGVDAGENQRRVRENCGGGVRIEIGPERACRGADRHAPRRRCIRLCQCFDGLDDQAGFGFEAAMSARHAEAIELRIAERGGQ